MNCPATPLPPNLGHLLRNTARNHPKKSAFFYKENGKYQSISWGSVSRKVRAVATFLLKEGLAPGDRLALISENRPEWAITDLAAQTIGVVTVPIYPSLSPSEIQYILKDSGACFLALSGKAIFEKIVSAPASFTGLKGLLAFDSALSLEGPSITVPIRTFADAEKTPPSDKLESIDPLVTSESLASIIYTSGTTGVPKGVMLTHGNFIHNVAMCKEAFRMDERDAHISFLPLCHVFERTAGYYLMVAVGASISYAENMDTVPQNIRERKPTFIFGVPRFFEKVEARVLETLKQSSPQKQEFFRKAMDLGRKKRLGERLRFSERMLWPIARLLVQKKFQKGLGGRIRFCVSGGAPLPKEIAEFFADLGVTICEGYGLTETSPVISANREGRCRFGSVGLPLKGVEVSIAEDGEILTKSPCVMKGYFNLPEETAAALVGGWLHTGDLGKIDAEGFLFITGRKKEIIVTSNGKKISPRIIEESLEKDPYILRVVLCGDGKKFITALLVPKESMILEYARSQKFSFPDYPTLLNDKKIQLFLDRRVQQGMAPFASYEQVKYFITLPQDFTQAAGELTPTLKVKRDVVLRRHKDLLDALYADSH